MSGPPAESGPAPTIWPATVAAGITMMGAGVVVDLSVWTASARLGFFLGGLVVFALGVAGWLRLLRDEDGGAMNEPTPRRSFLNRLSLGLVGLAGAVVAVPFVGYVLGPLLRPPRQAWIDMGPLTDLPQGQTVLRKAVDPGALKWAGQTADWAVWVRRSGDQAFTVFAINCAHLGCPVSWSGDANLFLCPCHGGVYYADGTVAGGPPPRPLFQYETRVQNGRLQVLSRPLGIG